MNLKFWQKEKKVSKNVTYLTPAGLINTRSLHRDPVVATLLNNYSGQCSLSLIDSMMAAIPLCNSAVSISAMLTGFPSIIDTGGDQGLKILVEDYIKNVGLNKFYRGIRGMRSFAYQMLYSSIAKGYSIAFTRTNRNRTDIDHIEIGNPNYYIWQQNSFGEKRLIDYDNNGQAVEDTNDVHIFTLRNKYGDPSGSSIFESVPFFARLLAVVGQAFTDQALRTGIPIYFISYTESDEEADPGQLAINLTAQLDSAIQSRDSGYASNIHAGNRGGEAKVEVVGEGAKNIIDLEINKITAYEQIITASHLSSQMFALYQWNQNYEMSEIEKHKTVGVISYYRNGIEPIILEPLQYMATVYGKNPAKITIKEWPQIDLIALDAQAQARLDNAKAREVELTNLQTEILLDLSSIEDEKKRLSEKVRNYQQTEMAKHYARKWEPKVY